MDIERLSLRNSGWFVVHLHVAVRPVCGGRVQEYKDEKDIPKLQERRIDLGKLGIPDGHHVRLKAHVIWSVTRDPVSELAFVYRKGCEHEAQFEISGTTFKNSLRFRGMALKPPG